MYKEHFGKSVEKLSDPELYDPDRALEVFETKNAEAYFSEIDPVVSDVIGRVGQGKYLSPEEKRETVDKVLDIIKRFCMDIREGEQVHKGIPVLSNNGKENYVSISKFDIVKKGFVDILANPDVFLQNRNSISFLTNIKNGRKKFLEALAESNPY